MHSGRSNPARACCRVPTQVDFVLADRGPVFVPSSTKIAPLSISTVEFYLQTADDRLCVRRDAVHSRIGGSCTIERFKQLMPEGSAVNWHCKRPTATFLDKR